MPPKSADVLQMKPLRTGRSRSRSPNPKGRKGATAKSNNYGSDGVKDNDIFQLPKSDYQLLLVLTVLAAIVRLFRIYQPSSVVFDEVQYVLSGFWYHKRAAANNHIS